MDEWDDKYREPTEDERAARRMLGLAIAIINAKSPLATSDIRRDFYADLGDAAFRKSFRRDLTRLVDAGVVIRRGAKRDDEVTWTLDESSSIARENVLTPEDALLVAVMLTPLAANPSIPFAGDLRLALAKIERSFDGSSQLAVPPKARRRSKVLSVVEDSISKGCAIQVHYARSDGEESDRTLAPYGLFHVHDTTYVVAARLDDSHNDDSPHTYALDRMSKIRALPRITYQIPSDFEIEDFVILPFQVGITQYSAVFCDKNGALHEYEVSDEGMAAAWAIAHEMRPVSPASLCITWQERLGRAASEAGYES